MAKKQEGSESLADTMASDPAPNATQTQPKSGTPTPVDPIAVAVAMKAKDPRLSVRNAARAVGITTSKLQRSRFWKVAVERLKQTGRGNPHRRDDGDQD
jgi:hypothetical protein